MVVGKVAEKEVVEDRSRLENDRLVEENLLVSALECPVCLTLPHSAPVYTCRVSRAKSGCDVSVVFVKKKSFCKPSSPGRAQCVWTLLEKSSQTTMPGLSHRVQQVGWSR